MLIPLICRQCGGKLEVERSQVFESGNVTIVSSGQTFTCPQCGTKYLPGETVKRVPEKTSVVINGNFNGGTIVIGNGIVVNKSPVPASAQTDQQVTQSPPENENGQKESKKWWEFWKA